MSVEISLSQATLDKAAVLCPLTRVCTPTLCLEIFTLTMGDATEDITCV